MLHISHFVLASEGENLNTNSPSPHHMYALDYDSAYGNFVAITGKSLLNEVFARHVCIVNVERH